MSGRYMVINQETESPRIHLMPEAKESPNRPSRQRSFASAPTNRPVGPELAYPFAYTPLKMASTSPMMAEGIGKQMPAISRKMRVEATISIKLACALWALLNSYHCLQVSFLEQQPEPISGYPPLSMSVPKASLCSCPKFSSMNSLVKICPLADPGKANPMIRISREMMTATSRTYPQVSGIEKITGVMAECIGCIYNERSLLNWTLYLGNRKQNLILLSGQKMLGEVIKNAVVME